MTRPNVLVITCHDAGRHFGCYGVETVSTPHIDALATDGVRFSRFFTSVPVCSPSRGAMLTGRYPQSNGLMGLTHSPWDWSLHPGERHLSHLLRDGGYHTALFGIQHEAADGETLAFAETHAGRGPDGKRPPAPAVAAAVAAFLRSRGPGDPPFYAQVGFFETHRPFDFGGVEPDDSRGVHVPPYLVDDEATVAQLAHLQGALARADDAVGIIAGALVESGLAEETILVFTVDHGIEFPRAKWYLYEAGIEIAFLLRWPGGGIRGGRTCDWLTSNVDFTPTLLELVDLPVPANMQGRSFAAFFGNRAASPPRDAVFALFESNGNVSRCIRIADHKLIRNFAPRRLLPVPISAASPLKLGSSFPRCPVAQLFDLEADPLETVNLADDAAHGALFVELDRRLWSWMEQVGDPILQGPVPTPYYREAIAGYQRQDAVDRPSPPGEEIGGQ